MVRPNDDRVMRIVAADWSGRITGERRHLWLAEVVDGRPRRLWNASRDEAAAALIALAEQDAGLVVGLDFCFSMPDWFLCTHRVASAPDLWADVDRLERWLRECKPPFWGRPGRARPPGFEEYRVTELRAGRPRPKSAFQIGGAGAVGTASLRGMPVLARLRDAGFHIWPFDPPGRPLVLEVWPRHLTVPPIVKSRADARAAYAGIPAAWRRMTDASEDAFDAAVSALGMHRRCTEITALPAIDDPVIQREGWIWGVALD